MRKFSIVMFIMTATALTACVPMTTKDVIVQSARQSTNTLAMTIEAAQSTAIILYRAEQMAVLDKAAKERWMEEKAKATLQDIRDGWKPLWTMFEKLREAHDTLRLVVQAATDTVAILNATSEVTKQSEQVAAFLKSARERINPSL